MLAQINKLSLPATILIAAFILGGFYYVTELTRSTQNQALQEEQAKTIQQLKDEIAQKSTASIVTPKPSTPVVSAGVSAQNLMDLKNQCATRADKFFNSGQSLAFSVAQSSSYTSHYNVSKKQCFIEINSTTPNYFMIELYDAIEGTMTGMVSVDFNSSTGQTGTVRTCLFNGIDGSCSSLQEFTDLANPYMKG